MPIEQVLRYAYNRSIPWFATCPSSLRLAAWARTDDPWRTLLRLWELKPVEGAPVVIRGLEIVENTPDLFSGAYHRYGQHRTLIYLVREGRRVFISLSKQADPSEAGKKGYTLGSDDDWNYFYSGEPGTIIGGLGWFETRLFDSAGIAIYIEPRPGGTRLANLKWLRGRLERDQRGPIRCGRNLPGDPGQRRRGVHDDVVELSAVLLDTVHQLGLRRTGHGEFGVCARRVPLQDGGSRPPAPVCGRLRQHGTLKIAVKIRRNRSRCTRRMSRDYRRRNAA
jgi:hypothetical protein